MKKTSDMWHLCGKAICATALALSLSLSAVQAAEMPGMDKTVVLNAREQPVALFFGELFGQIGVPAQVDESIIGSVNGDFRKPAGELVDEIAAAFQLAVYFDGAVAHIYPANDISRNVVHMSSKSAGSVKRAAEKLGMVDSRNTLSVTDLGLVVTGAKRFVEQVDRLANAVSKKAKVKPSVSPDTYQIFKLKYAWADDVSLVFGGETVVVPGVATLMRALIEPGAIGTPATTRTQNSSSLDGLRGQGLQSQAGQSGQATPSQVPLPVSGPATPGSTSRTRIVADTLSNSVIIRDRPDRMSTYATLIASLDKEPQMIEIEATIIDLDTDKLRELGINWRLQGENGEGLLGNGTITDQLLRPGEQVTPRGEGGVVSLLLGSQDQFIARIRALETQGAAQIVSKPHVMTLSNVEALLDTTSTFFVRVAGQEEVDLFDVKVGTTLRVTPHVYENAGRSQIKLRVNILDGTTSDQSVEGIPIVEESTINTQAIIDVGQSLLIGGLVREIKADGVSRVPVLGSIPGLGALFRTKITTSSRKERMFLITPRLSATTVAGKRFSAPILSGTESDIISSAGVRMAGTRQALDLLETAPDGSPVYTQPQQIEDTQTLQPSTRVQPIPFPDAVTVPVAPIPDGWQEVKSVYPLPEDVGPADVVSVQQPIPIITKSEVADTSSARIEQEKVIVDTSQWQTIQ